MGALVLPLFETKYCVSWPPLDPDKPANQIEYKPLDIILQTQWATDAHFAAYSRPDCRARLNRRAPGQLPGGVTMRLLIVDVDIADDYMSPDQWAQEQKKIQALADDNWAATSYRTRRGYRLLWAISPITITDEASVNVWENFYMCALLHLDEQFGIVGDAHCMDWTRLYRAPNVVRAD